MITLKTTTYGCECGYTMDNETYNRTNPTYFEKKGLIHGTCPSCKQHQLAQVLDFDKMSTHKTIEQADIDAETKEAKDNHGQTIQEQVGERYQLNPNTGAIEKRPIEVPKQVPLTDQEKTAKLEQAQRSLDALAAITVKQVSE